MLKPIAVATAICGTLDILFAMILTVAFGRQIGNMLRFVASGPSPPRPKWGLRGAVLGLVVHFALMAVDGDGLRPRGSRSPFAARPARAGGPGLRPPHSIS